MSLAPLRGPPIQEHSPYMRELARPGYLDIRYLWRGHQWMSYSYHSVFIRNAENLTKLLLKSSKTWTACNYSANNKVKMAFLTKTECILSEYFHISIVYSSIVHYSNIYYQCIIVGLIVLVLRIWPSFARILILILILIKKKTLTNSLANC
jgi:hypothetical protein